MLVDWEHETNDPLAELDAIYREYEKSKGKGWELTAEEVNSVRKTKAMLLTWWGWHRESIRAALVLAQQPAASDVRDAEWSADDHALWNKFVTLRELDTEDVPLPDVIKQIRSILNGGAA